jgi:CRP-like cAMP-binding protein
MLDPGVIKSLVPINALNADNFRKLVEHVTIEQIPAGGFLFRQGDMDKYAVYLLTGEAALTSTHSSLARTIKGGTDEAQYALAQLKPRQYTGVAKADASIARVDGEILDRLLTWDQATGYEVAEYDSIEDGEWMLHLLHHSVFEKLPTANVNALFARMEPVTVKAGDVIVRQGEPGDYYYIIKSGRASVTRKPERVRKNRDPERTTQDVSLGELGECDGFGEEALLSKSPRNATVVMLTDGALMRLAAKDFHNLLEEPLVDWVSDAEARSMVKMGVGLIDVRLEEEHRGGAIKDSLNIPLYLLRLKAATLDPERRYILYCDTGSRSCAAAFLLTQRGFDVRVLQGGLNSLIKAV